MRKSVLAPVVAVLFGLTAFIWTNLGVAQKSGMGTTKNVQKDTSEEEIVDVEVLATSMQNRSPQKGIIGESATSMQFDFISVTEARLKKGCTDEPVVNIPSEVQIGGKTYTVTMIGNKAFDGCEGLTSVTIPSSVTSIGMEAFRDCSGLTSVSIPFGVTSIGFYAFSGCSGLTSISIPSSVTSIGWYAFSGCSGLTCISIPSSVTSIEDCTFSGCSGLTSVTIPSGVSSIGEYAFYGCSGLTSVTIPSSVTSIGKEAFHKCNGLTNISIPSGVSSIGDVAFSRCGRLTSINVSPSNPNYTSVNGVLYDKEMKKIIACPGGVKGGVIIPSGITSIGERAFEYCSGLTSVTIPSGVTSIGERAFEGCSGLTSVTIPSSVTSIGRRAFWGCDNLDVVIDNSKGNVSVDDFTFGEGAFDGCKSVTWKK